MDIEDYIETADALDVLERYTDYRYVLEPTKYEQLLLDWGFLERHTERIGISRQGKELLIHRKPTISQEIVDDVIERIYWGKYQDYVIDYLEMPTKFIFRIESPDEEVSLVVIKKDVTLQTLKTRVYTALKHLAHPYPTTQMESSPTDYQLANKRALEFLDSIRGELEWSKYIDGIGLVTILETGYIRVGTAEYCSYTTTGTPRPDLVATLLFYLNYDTDTIKAIITQHLAAKEARQREQRIRQLLEKRSMNEIKDILRR